MGTHTIWIGPKGFEIKTTDREGGETVESGFSNCEDALARINAKRQIQMVANEPAKARTRTILVRLRGILGLCNW